MAAIVSAWSFGSTSRSVLPTTLWRDLSLALHCGLRFAQPLAGILALSSYLPLASHTDAERHHTNYHTPIFMGHGTLDPLVPISFGQTSCQYLQQLGLKVTWQAYPMAHQVCAEEIHDIRQWLLQQLGSDYT